MGLFPQWKRKSGKAADAHAEAENQQPLVENAAVTQNGKTYTIEFTAITSQGSFVATLVSRLQRTAEADDIFQHTQTDLHYQLTTNFPQNVLADLASNGLLTSQQQATLEANCSNATPTATP